MLNNKKANQRFSCFSQLRFQKKANLVTDNTVGLIIAAAGIVVLVFLLFALYSPTYDENDETAKSYMESLQKAIKGTEDSGFSSFSLWMGDPKMVYFGDKLRVVVGEDAFYRKNKGKNVLCFCYEPTSKKWVCKSCVSLDLPVEFRIIKDYEGGVYDYLYFFKGEEYWSYDYYYDEVGANYPKKTSVGLDSELEGDFDAALKWNDDYAYFFKGDKHWEYRYTLDAGKGGIFRSILKEDYWSGLPNDIDAALKWDDDYSYFFKGDKCWKYNTKKFEIEKNYPKQISDEWSGLPNDIDAALKWDDDYSYFFKGDKYWKYDNKNNKVIHNKSLSAWAGIPVNLDAVLMGSFESWRAEQTDLNIFEEGWHFDIEKKKDKYLFIGDYKKSETDK